MTLVWKSTTLRGAHAPRSSRLMHFHISVTLL
jgi:hypothetical protein